MVNRKEKYESGPHVPLLDDMFAHEYGPSQEARTTVATPVQFVLAERALARNIVTMSNRISLPIANEARQLAALSDDEVLLRSKPHYVRTWADAQEHLYRQIMSYVFVSVDSSTGAPTNETQS